MENQPTDNSETLVNPSTSTTDNSSTLLNQTNNPSISPMPTPTISVIENPPVGIITPNQPVNNGQPAIIASDFQNSVSKSKKPKLLIILLILFFVLIASGGVFAFHNNNPKDSSSSTTSNSNNSRSTTPNQGSNSTGTIITCTTETCFAPKFASCSAATLNYDAGIAAVRYQILGTKASGCSMSFEYTSNPNSAWVNQPMTCTFNNKEPLDTSIQDVINIVISKSNKSDCTGPLVGILQKV